MELVGTDDDLCKFFCINSIKKSVKDPQIPPTENFDMLAALESIFPLTDLVFTYLNYFDLKMCMLVNKSWNEAANRELNKRIKASWFTIFKGGNDVTSNIIKCSNNLNYINVALGIILYDFSRIKLNKYMCLHKTDLEAERKSVPEYIEEEIIPPKTDYCVISCPRVISYLEKHKPVCKASYFDGLFLPKIPNIKMKMFYCNPVKVAECKATIRKYISDNDEIKCLLLFSSTDREKSLNTLLRHMIPAEIASTVAVGGGIIKGSQTFEQLHSSKRLFSKTDIFCIAFFKEIDVQADFNAFSCVIVGNDLSNEEFAQEVYRFKQNVILRINSVVFRICCSAKVGADEEPPIFKACFPGIPIFGFHADGEIGWNCYLSSSQAPRTVASEAKAKRPKCNYPKVKHNWSTVFVLLTWGNIM